MNLLKKYITKHKMEDFLIWMWTQGTSAPQALCNVIAYFCTSFTLCIKNNYTHTFELDYLKATQMMHIHYTIAPAHQHLHFY